MKIILTVGHSILKNGNCTSADGRPFGGVLEYAYNKNIVHRVAEYLRKAGHQVDVLICPELQLAKSTDEKAYKVPKVNAGNYDLVAELHLNASKYHNARGCEVLYICEKGKEIAERIHARLAAVFSARGIQRRTDLYMLTQTKPVALIIESFFCDNSNDCALAEKTDVARLIAEGIHGGEIPGGAQESQEGGEPSRGILYRVQAGAFSKKENAERLMAELKARGFEAFIATVDNGGKILYRVQVGAYSVKSNAEAMQRRLQAAGYDTYLIKA